MRSRLPGFAAGTRETARVELRELAMHPGLYLFVPMILIQTLGSAISVGAFDSPLLSTPGTLAAGAMNTLTLLLCMLLLFYTVESLQRERSSGLGAITYATPLGTGAMLLGKIVADLVIVALVLLAALIGQALVLAYQGKVPFRLEPFALCWGALLLPTFVLWTSFVMAVFTLTASRTATYAVGLGALALTGFLQARGHMSWAFNWDLWSATRWSDISVFEIDRLPLVLNRVTVLALAALFVVLTVRLFPRREADATLRVHRLRPAALGRAALALAPLVLLPLVTGAALWVQVQRGFEGDRAKKLMKDYWKKNVATWRDADLPAMAAVDLDVRLDPARRRFAVAGTYALIDPHAGPLAEIPLTEGFAWDSVTWTMNGAPYKPDDRAHLEVFTPPRPLAPGDTLRIGFRYSGVAPSGISRNGAGQMEFLLPSGAVFTGFSGPTLVPQIGLVDGIGPEKKDLPEPRQYPDDAWRDTLPAMIPLAERAFTTRIRVAVPAEFRAVATGVLERESVNGGWRTATWVSDHPVKLFNLIAGRWAERRGRGVVVYYHPSHTYNLDEMVQALEGARRWYSEWFAPYPWRELRLSEFAGLATYAQGSPTNISFSEGIGFLTRSEPKANAAFWVTAHEAAHQWWGNILTPSSRPGGDVLSEGMAHFSTILLTEQVKGEQQRIAFCREIETRYGRTRRPDAERPLSRIDGSHDGDQQIIYDKGGFAAWMMMQLIGRERMLEGLREFIALYRDNPDHPVLHDFLAVMRRHAPDPAAFDAFADQWYGKVVVPEYRLRDAHAERDSDGWVVRATVRNAGTGTMPVEVAAVSGERFADPKEKRPPYRDARITVVLGPKQAKPIEIHCAFEPERLVADPDFKVLQLQRNDATTKVEIARAPATRMAAAF